MVFSINKTIIKTALVVGFIVIQQQQAYAACCGAAAVSAINSRTAALKSQLSSGFSSVNSNINGMEQTVVKTLKDTHAEQMSAQKKISDVATKTQEDLNKAFEQIAESESFNESKKYSSRQYGDDSMPEDLCKQTAIGDAISHGGNRDNIIKQIEEDNKEIQDKKLEEYGKQKSVYNQYVNALPGNGRYIMSDLLGQETISSEDGDKIASLLDHLIDNSKENTFSEQELSTVAGQVNQAKSNNLSIQKELLKNIFVEQIIYPKVEIIRNGEQSASSYSLIKKNVNDRFTNGFEPVVSKNDVAILREIKKIKQSVIR